MICGALSISLWLMKRMRVEVLENRIKREIRGLGIADHSLGFLFAALRSWLALSVVYWLVTVFVAPAQLPTYLRPGFTAPFTAEIAKLWRARHLR